MNREQAKVVLLLYRNEADAEDPQIAEALALAKNDPELAAWFEEHRARQNAFREKFRDIAAPPGLKEQIISEQKALARSRSRREKLVLATAVAAIVASLVVIAMFLPRERHITVAAFNHSFTNYQNSMVNAALNGYGMNLATNSLDQIHNYLARNQAPADYVLPAPLQQVAATGCAIQGWDGDKVSMICFRTGKPLPPNLPGDLWLFVVDRTSVTNAPDSSSPQFSQIGKIAVAAWTQNGKLYLLGTEGDQQTIQKYL